MYILSFSSCLEVPNMVCLLHISSPAPKSILSPHPPRELLILIWPLWGEGSTAHCEGGGRCIQYAAFQPKQITFKPLIIRDKNLAIPNTVTENHKTH